MLHLFDDFQLAKVRISIVNFQKHSYIHFSLAQPCFSIVRTAPFTLSES